MCQSAVDGTRSAGPRRSREPQTHRFCGEALHTVGASGVMKDGQYVGVDEYIATERLEHEVNTQRLLEQRQSESGVQ